MAQLIFNFFVVAFAAVGLLGLAIVLRHMNAWILSIAIRVHAVEEYVRLHNEEHT